MAGLSNAQTAQVVQSLAKQGAKVDERHGGWLVQFPDGSGGMFRGTNSDSKSINAQRALVKKAGFIWPLDDKRAAKKAEKEGVLRVSGDVIDSGYPRYMTESTPPSPNFLRRVLDAAERIQADGQPVTQPAIARLIGTNDPTKINQGLYHAGFRWTQEMVAGGPDGRKNTRAWSKPGQSFVKPLPQSQPMAEANNGLPLLIAHKAEEQIIEAPEEAPEPDGPKPPTDAEAPVRDDAHEWEAIAREQEERANAAERERDAQKAALTAAEAETARVKGLLAEANDRATRIQGKFDLEKQQWLRREEEMNRSLEGLRVQRERALARAAQNTAPAVATDDGSWVIKPQDGKPWTQIIEEAENYGLTVEVRARRVA